MGQIWTRINKSYYRFNAENRVHRYLDKNISNPAPKHPSTIKHMDSLMPDDETKEALQMKNEQLDKNLKQVYVKSFDPPSQILNKYGKPSEKMRKLPVNRSSSNNIFSYLEPEYVPKGKLSLHQAMQLVKSHEEDPKKFNPAYLSEQYNLPISDIENILTYFTNFKLFLPASSKLENKEKLNILNIVKNKVLLVGNKKEEKQK